MSCIIAIKKNDRFYLGSDGRVSTEMFNYSDKNNDLKLWKRPDGLIIGCCGDGTVAELCKYDDDVIPYKDVIAGEINTQYLFLNFHTALANEYCKFRGIQDTSKPLDSYIAEMNSTFLIAYNDHCWEIDPFGYINEVKNYTAIGCTKYDALTSIQKDLKVKGMTIEKIINNAIDISSKHSLGVDNNVVILSTDSSNV